MINIKKTLVRFKNADIKSQILYKNIFFSFLIRGTSMLVSLFTLPAYMNFLPDTMILGMWFTAISMLSWILTFDLGIGNGLRNYLVKPFIKRDTEEIRKNISSAYISVGVVVLSLSIASIVLIPLLNWNKIFNISINIIDRDTLLFMVTMLIIGILIQFWLKLIISILYALQKASIPGLLSLTTSILMLLFTLGAKTNDTMFNIKSLSVAYIFTANIPYLIATIYIFNTELKNCKPSIKYFNKSYAARVIKLGGIFFYLQILTMVMFSTNEFLITWLVNPEEVVAFQIYNKLFSILSTFFNLSLTPVWSAVTEANVKKDYMWITRLYKKLNIMLFALIPIEIILILLMPTISNFWLGGNSPAISMPYSIVFALYNILYMKVTVDTSLVAGLGTLNVQTIALTITTVLKIILSLIFTYITNSWISIIVANVLSLVPYIIIEYYDIKNKFNNFREGGSYVHQDSDSIF